MMTAAMVAMMASMFVPQSWNMSIRRSRMSRVDPVQCSIDPVESLVDPVESLAQPLVGPHRPLHE